MKKFTVVFPVCKSGNKFKILMGKQPEGKPLAGYRNGYGGKVEETDQSLERAAKREILEELGLEVENLKNIGKVTVGIKEIYFYVTFIQEQEYGDGAEMIDNKWYELANDEFVRDMLPGDADIINYLRNNIEKINSGENIELFDINKNGKEIEDATLKLDRSIGVK